MVTVALSPSELRYRRLFEAAHDGILIVDLETRRILEANPFAGELLGYPDAEIRPLPLVAAAAVRNFRGETSSV